MNPSSSSRVLASAGCFHTGYWVRDRAAYCYYIIHVSYFTSSRGCCTALSVSFGCTVLWCCTSCRHRQPPVHRPRGPQFYATTAGRRRYAAVLVASKSRRRPAVVGWRTNGMPATTGGLKRGWTPSKRTTVRLHLGNLRWTLPVPRYVRHFERFTASKEGGGACTLYHVQPTLNKFNMYYWRIIAHHFKYK